MAFILMQFLFSKILLFESFSPVGLPFAVIRIFLEKNLFSVTISYLLSKTFFFSDIKILLITIFEVIVIALYYFSKEFIKTKKERFLMCVFVALSSVLKLYYSFLNLNTLILFFIEFFIKIFAVIYFHKFFAVYKTKFIFFKFSHLDYFVFSLMVFLLSMGLFSFDFIQKYAGLFVISVILIFACRIFPVDKYFVVLSMVSVGAAIITGESLYLILSVLAAVILMNFKDLNKYFYVSFVSVCFACFVIIFKFYSDFSYFSFIFAVFLFILTPNYWILKCTELFEQDSFNIVCSELQNSKVMAIKQKLQLMSDTLFNMQNNFKFLIVGKISRQKASAELCTDVIEKCCKNCENYKNCFLENINKKQLFENLLFKAIENKQVSKNDLSNGLQVYCMKSGIIINEINQTARMFLSYENAMKNEDTSKLLIASELGNFSDIFSNFAKMLKYSLKINKNSSKMLKESLTNGLIDAKEVVILENEYGIESVNIIAENQVLTRRELVEILKRNLKNNMVMKNVKHLNLSGLGLATFVPAGRFRINFAVSSKAKELKNGDNVTVAKLSDNKYFLALADGMGHGESANKISSMVLSLVKSMFEVGIDDELVIQSVNKLLVPAGLDNFTTIDACVIDLEKEVCNFIKLGSSVSVIKHKNTSEIIASDSLPMGIVSCIKPTIIKTQISYGDTIFLASDGVVDSFSSIEEYKHFINDAKIYNLQKFADNLVFDAGFQNTKHPDDMTVIAINLLKN